MPYYDENGEFAGYQKMCIGCMNPREDCTCGRHRDYYDDTAEKEERMGLSSSSYSHGYNYDDDEGTR